MLWVRLPLDPPKETMTFNGIEYEIYYCPVHKKHIHYFKANRAFKGYHCWDCIRESNLKKEKYHERGEQEEVGEDQGDLRDSREGLQGADQGI